MIIFSQSGVTFKPSHVYNPQPGTSTYISQSGGIGLNSQSGVALEPFKEDNSQSRTKTHDFQSEGIGHNSLLRAKATESDLDEKLGIPQAYDPQVDIISNTPQLGNKVQQTDTQYRNDSYPENHQQSRNKFLTCTKITTPCKKNKNKPRIKLFDNIEVDKVNIDIVPKKSAWKYY